MKTGTKKQLGEMLLSYSKDRDNLLPILREVQQRFGYLPEEAMEEVAKYLRLSNSTVYAVATFYDHLRFTPPAKKTVRVCHGPACHLQGSTSILGEVEERLGVKPGETTGDLKYSFETSACSGACALAPMIEVDYKVYGKMTKAELKNVLDKK